MISRIERSTSFEDDDEIRLPFRFRPQSPISSQLSKFYELTERSCLTSGGDIGSCGTINDCYPNIRLPVLNNVDRWIFGLQDKCSYQETQGKEVSI